MPTDPAHRPSLRRAPPLLATIGVLVAACGSSGPEATGSREIAAATAPPPTIAPAPAPTTTEPPPTVPPPTTLPPITPPPTTLPPIEPRYAWTQYGAHGLEARAIVEGDTCPTAVVDGAEIEMAVRAAPDVEFPVTTCTVALGGSAGAISVGSTTLEAAAGPGRLLVLGDSGCQVTQARQENCDGTGTGAPWSFADTTSSAVGTRPDLIVHVGDFVDREAPCDGERQPGCAGSPWGDNWATWEAEFFEPAAPLLTVAPWILTRGNHEDCDRNHRGWTRFLDGRPLDAAGGCRLFGDPYVVELPRIDVVVLDTATDPAAPGLEPSARERYTADVARAAQAIPAGRPAWIVTHRPFWAVTVDAGGLGTTSATLQAAIADAGGWPAAVEVAASGHVHVLQTLTFDDGRPNQLVVGDAGTTEDLGIPSAAVDANPQVFEQLGMSSDGFRSADDTGFVLVEFDPTLGWVVFVHDAGGEVQARVALPAPG